MNKIFDFFGKKMSLLVRFWRLLSSKSLINQEFPHNSLPKYILS